MKTYLVVITGLMLAVPVSCTITPLLFSTTRSVPGSPHQRAYQGLTHIPPDIPSDTNLLNLTGNTISILRVSSFSNLPFLRELILKNNQIVLIEQPGAFSGVTILRLDLSGNQLRRVNSQLFLGLTSLTHLWLNNNPIVEIEPFAFSNLRFLRQLHLRQISVPILRQNSFTGLKSPELIDLSHGQLIGIEAEAFNRTRTIETPWDTNTLRLSNNRIGYLTQGMFHGLEWLTNLDLSYNQIPSIPSGVLEGVSFVNFLNLSHNSIRELWYMYNNTGSHSSFWGWPIPEGNIDLDYNQISDPDLLPQAWWMKSISLHHNLFTTLNYGHSFYLPRRIGLSGNPLICGPNLYWLWYEVYGDRDCHYCRTVLLGPVPQCTNCDWRSWEGCPVRGPPHNTSPRMSPMTSTSPSVYYGSSTRRFSSITDSESSETLYSSRRPPYLRTTRRAPGARTTPFPGSAPRTTRQPSGSTRRPANTRLPPEPHQSRITAEEQVSLELVLGVTAGAVVFVLCAAAVVVYLVTRRKKSPEGGRKKPSGGDLDTTDKLPAYDYMMSS